MITMMSKRNIKTVLSVLVTLICLFFLYSFAKETRTSLSSLPKDIQFKPLIYSFLIFLVATFIAAYLWMRIATELDIRFDSFIHLKIYLTTLAARRLPGSVLHIVGRGAMYFDLGVKPARTGFASGVEYILILWSGILVFLISIFGLVKIEQFQVLLLILLFAILTALIHPSTLQFLLSKLIKTKMKEAPKIHYKSLLAWIVGYIGLWVLGGVILLCILASIYPIKNLNFFALLAAWTGGGVSGMLVAALPSGLGLTELTMSLILGQFIPPSIAVIVSILSRIILTAFDILVSLVSYALWKVINPKGLL
jgi:glycosyltransferase 2 family protein